MRSEEQKKIEDKDDDRLNMLLAKLNTLEHQMKQIQRQPRWQYRKRWQENLPAPQPNQGVTQKEIKPTVSQPAGQSETRWRLRRGVDRGQAPTTPQEN